jgi:hypothetical protein
MTIEQMNEALNSKLNVPTFPAVAVTGEGVFPTLKAIAGFALKAVENMSKTSPIKGGKSGPAPLSVKKFVPKSTEESEKEKKNNSPAKPEQKKEEGKTSGRQEKKEDSAAKFKKVTKSSEEQES